MKTENFNPLYLVVKSEAFEAIQNGYKKEEYREIKEYWKTRIEGKHFNHVEFRNGYQADCKTMLVELRGISKGMPNPDLCLGIIPTDKEVYILRLGRIVDVNF
jgi:hypothetical protein